MIVILTHLLHLQPGLTGHLKRTMTTMMVLASPIGSNKTLETHMKRISKNRRMMTKSKMMMSAMMMVMMMSRYHHDASSASPIGSNGTLIQRRL